MCIKLEIINKLYYDARPTKYQDLMGLFGVKSSLMISHMNMTFTSNFSVSVSFPSGFDVMNAPKLFCDWLVGESVCLSKCFGYQVHAGGHGQIFIK